MDGPPDPDAPATRQVTIHEAKTQLSRLIAAANRGETVVIARGATPVARLVPYEPARRPAFGSMKGLITLDEAFFDPLPDDELEAWGEI